MKTRPIITFLFVQNRRVSPGPIEASTKGYIYCRLTVKGQKKEFATGIQLVYSEWSTAAHRLLGRTTAIKQANESLTKMEDRLNDLAADLDRQNKPVTAAAIYALYRNNGAALGMVALYDAFLAERKKLVGVEISQSSYQLTVWRRQLLLDFLAARKLAGLRPEEFTHSLADYFLQWCLVEKGFKRNYANKALQVFAQCLVWGVRRDVLARSPLAHYKYKAPERREIKYLAPAELARLSTAPIAAPCLGRVRDCFVFQCWTGLAYADLSQLDVSRAEYQRDAQGTVRRVLRIRRQKSTLTHGYECVIPLLPEAERILATYDDVLPVPSNQKFNRYLKELGALAGLGADKMTSHVGRKTAGVLMLNAGLRMETVSKFLGHSSVRMTEKVYAKILDTTVVDEFSAVFGARELAAPAPVLELPSEATPAVWRRPPPVTSWGPRV